MIRPSALSEISAAQCRAGYKQCYAEMSPSGEASASSLVAR
jgi:hypothetical protein